MDPNDWHQQEEHQTCGYCSEQKYMVDWPTEPFARQCNMGKRSQAIRWRLRATERGPQIPGGKKQKELTDEQKQEIKEARTT